MLYQQKISLTSYHPPLKNILINLIRVTGATYSANLTRSCTHLLCPSDIDPASSQKLEQAKRCGINVIRDGKRWLEGCIAGGGMPGVMESKASTREPAKMDVDEGLGKRLRRLSFVEEEI